jgi:hypothetical protein
MAGGMAKMMAGGGGKAKMMSGGGAMPMVERWQESPCFCW